jgi:pimeloyl-ACP methyl ester carboxylesterase
MSPLDMLLCDGAFQPQLVLETKISPSSPFENPVMFHQLPLLLALSIAPSAMPALEPAAATSGAVLDRDGRTSIAYDRSGSLVGNSGQGLGGLPTYGATSSGGVNTVNRGRMDLGNGQVLDYYTISLASSVTGSGFQEDFILFTPNVPKGVVRPLLVAFHGYGFSQKDIVFNTDFVSECAQRGWYMLAPLSASGGHFMCDPGQLNTEVAMDWTLNKFSVDLTRIYAVGFSMGGGMALNYGARHLDPLHGTFAAIVNHTGSVDLIDTYENDPASAFVFDFWYGDQSPNSADYDLMRRGSVIEWDPVAQQVNPNTDLVRNLNHVPLKSLRGSNDPLTGLTLQCDRLDAHLLALGRTPGTDYSYEIVNSNKHTWDTLDGKAACDWLAQFTLNLPTQQRTIAATEGYYFHFFVDQTDNKLLTPFTWEVDPVANELRLSETANLTKLSVQTINAGLSTDQQLSVVMSTADNKVNQVGLTGFAVQPVSVSRDGMVLPTTHWGYAPDSGMVTLTEWDGSSVHTYTIQP